jgi:AraC-like DNA-binding protein
VRSFPLDHQLNLITSNIISLNAHDEVYVALAKAKASEIIGVALDRLLSESHYEDDSPIKLRAKDKEAIKLARDILVLNLAEAPTIRELCTTVGLNRNKLHYGFREQFGMSPSQYLEDQRLERAYISLRDTGKLIYQIAADVGYMNQGSFSTAFKRKYGLTPKDARSSHQNPGPVH